MGNIKSAKTVRQKKVPKLTIDEWERGWQLYWRKAGFTSYELPVDEHNKTNDEYQFLMTARTREREIERLGRITTQPDGTGYKIGR